jgi:integrase
MKTRKPKNRPVETVVEKGQHIPIYLSPVTSKGKTYQSFLVAYIEAGTRMRKRAATLEDARTVALSAARQLAEGVGHVRTLTPAQIADFAAAEKLLRKYPGRSLTAVVAEWAAAQVALGGGSIVEACSAHRKLVHKESGFTPASVKDVYEAFIAELKRDGASSRYVEDCTSRMGRLKDTFRGFIHNVTREDLSGWLDRLKVKPRTRKNFRAAAVSLFKFAKERGHLPRNLNTEAELLPATKRLKSVEKDSEIGFYSREDFRKMLAGAPEHLLPVFAIGGFAGLRSVEIFRLKWEDIREREIIVQAENAKTGSRRVVPIVPALACWLTKIKRGEADASLFPRYSKESALARAVSSEIKAAGVSVVHNGLRHSFCTYRLADVQDAPRVALEAGNSPTMLFRHYRALATAAEGREWFSIVPEGMEGVLRTLQTGRPGEEKREEGEKRRLSAAARPPRIGKRAKVKKPVSRSVKVG